MIGINIRLKVNQLIYDYTKSFGDVLHYGSKRETHAN